MASTVLAIEDNPDILEILQFNLSREGFSVVKAMDGDEGLKQAFQVHPDLILLDLMLPKRDGIEVCRQLRARSDTKAIPIIMLTAKGEESDIVRGLEVGADDYVTKPFSPKELVARVKAALRRATAPSASPSEVIRFKELTIDLSRHEVTLGSEILRLTPAEFRLLKALVSARGRVFTRDQLIEKIGGPEVAIVDRNIDVHVSSLRKKLKNLGDDIMTVRGVGYRIRD